MIVFIEPGQGGWLRSSRTNNPIILLFSKLCTLCSLHIQLFLLSVGVCVFYIIIIGLNIGDRWDSFLRTGWGEGVDGAAGFGFVSSFCCIEGIHVSVEISIL